MHCRSLAPDFLERMEKTANQTAEARNFLEQLRKKEVPVFLTVNPTNQAVLYEAPLSDTQIVSFVISPDGEVKLSHSALSSALVLYVAEEDKKADETMLRKRYDTFYTSLSRLCEISPKDRQKYLKGQEALTALKNRLAITSDVPKKTTPEDPSLQFVTPKLAYSVSDSIEYIQGIVPVVVGKTKHRSRSFFTFFRQVESDGIINDGKGRILRVGMAYWSERDRNILFALSSILRNMESRAGNYFTSEDIVKIIQSSPGVPIFAQEGTFLIDEEVRYLDPTMDEEGILHVASPQGQLLISSGNDFLYYDEATMRIYLYSYRNNRQRVLANFVMENPKFPYALLEEEFATDILPLVNQSVQLSEGYKKKVTRYKNTIEYYITYEEEGAPVLEIKTKYLSRGNETTKEEFATYEEASLSKFEDALSALGLKENARITKDEEIGRIISQNLSSLAETCSLFLSDNIVPSLVKTPGKFSISTRSGLDWFAAEFHHEDYDDETIAAILSGYKKKKKFIRVGSQFYSLSDASMQQIADAFYSDGTEELTQEKLPLYKALRLKNTAGVDVNFDEGLEKLFDRLLHYSSFPLTCPPSISKNLRPYQENGVQWLSTLSSLQLGGILADDMGLGKTLEMIAYLSQEKEEAPILIVCPKSLIFNWRNEFQKWDPSTEVVIVHGGKAERASAVEKAKAKKKMVLVISYDSLRIDEEAFRGIHFSNVVLDEAQYIANALAKKTKAVKGLDATHRFVLTGTPIQNSLLDLWSIMDFLMPGYLDGFNEFRSIYQSYSDSKSAELSALESQVAPFILRRTKEEVLKDLPPKSEEIITISMEPKEKRLYEAYFLNLTRQVTSPASGGNDRIAILAEITRLRQLCVDPSVFMENFHDVSSKLEHTISMVSDAILGGHKVLVFSSFVSVLKHLEALLGERGIPAYLIYGDVPAEKRIELANSFNSSNQVSVMLVSLKAGGTGLNLVGADIVIHLDPWWNLAAENQASDRAHRIGQTRPVSIYKLVAEGTVEEKMIALQEMKRNLTGIIRVSDGSGSGLTEEDIRFLLS